LRLILTPLKALLALSISTAIRKKLFKAPTIYSPSPSKLNSASLSLPKVTFTRIKVGRAFLIHNYALLNLQAELGMDLDMSLDSVRNE
jgi:hypothetical protein